MWNENISCLINKQEISQTSAIESESESHSAMSDSLRPHGLYSPWNSPGQNTEVGSLSLLQGIFPTQGFNSGLPLCKRILYQLSPKVAVLQMWMRAPQTAIQQMSSPTTVIAEELRNARSSHLPYLLLLKVNKEIGFGPRELRYMWKKWIQWAQRLASFHI